MEYVRKLGTLNSLGYGINSGLLAKVRLRHPQYVAYVLLKRSFYGISFSYPDRWKFLPDTGVKEATQTSSFKVRRGILEGMKFEPALEKAWLLPPDIISGSKKVKSRIQVMKLDG